VALLMLCVASCACLAPRIRFVPPVVPPPVTLPSATAERGGVWVSEADAKAILKERIILRSIIEAYRAYWEKTR